MCTYQTLYADSISGQVIHCHQCRHLQVAFGNLAITLTYTEFVRFKNYIAEIATDYMTQAAAQCKTIAVPTPCVGMKILLNPFELNRLNAMLEHADTEYHSSQLLNLFH